MDRLGTTVYVLFFLISLVSTSEPDHHDCGSCGNPCCLMEFKFPISPEDAYTAFVNSLKSVSILVLNHDLLYPFSLSLGQVASGVDKHYSFVAGSDIRKENLTSGAKYRIQATHPSLNASFNDTLSFVLASNSSSTTIVRAFSISPIEAALCDSGQNFKNLANFVQGLSQDFAQKFSFGCTDTMGYT